MNSSQSVDLYPSVLEGMRVEERFLRPTGEFFIVATSADAEELKARMERYIPKRSYTVLDENDKPVGHVVTEPEITVLDIP